LAKESGFKCKPRRTAGGTDGEDEEMKMFEMTYTTADGRRVRGGMAFDSFSHAKNGSYLTKGGSMISRKDWSRFKGAVDELGSPAGEKPKKPMNWHASAARNDLNAALKKLCDVMGWEHEDMAGQIGDILDEAEAEQVRAHAATLGVGGNGAGKGALDDDDEDDDASVERRVREFLASKGLDSETIEEALKRVKADREAAAKDRLPLNGRHGTGGHTSRGPSGSRYDETDFMKDYPASVTTADPYGEPVSRRLERDADPAREAGERAAARLPGGGVSRRLAAGDEALGFDAELTQLIENVKVGMFG
jgi:hypothetical protein